jgi:drug/metabolite transporter (DMT)-like permease
VLGCLFFVDEGADRSLQHFVYHPQGVLLWNWTISKLGAVVATNWVYFNPITTIIFAWWLLNEQITPWFLLGTLLILVGMYLCDKKK